jgi:hypothetical protein
MSPLLSRLNTELRAATDLEQRAELGARIAGYLARAGEFAEAKVRIDALRQEFGHGESGRVTVWLMLAEGLLHLYQDLSPAALDRVNRAQALARAMRYSTMTALATAWKAHIEFETSKFDLMIRSLQLALSEVGTTEHDAQTRIAMVLSNSYMICGEVAAANRWFHEGRAHAVKNGDQASIEALLYNRAAFGLAWLRVAHCDEARSREELRVARMEIQSARNLQDLIGIQALSNHILLWEARLCVLEERFLEAIERLTTVRTKSPFARYNFSQSFIDLELAFCYARTNDSAAALDALRRVDRTSLDQLDADEQIVARWLMLELAEFGEGFAQELGHLVELRHEFTTLKMDYFDSRRSLAARLAAIDPQAKTSGR